MAETTVDTAQLDISETAVDLDTGADIASSTETARSAQQHETAPHEEEIARLRRENQELSQAVARRERNAQANAEAQRLAERLAHLEGRLTATPQDTRSGTSQHALPEELTDDELDQALTKWLNNDKSGLSVFRRALNRPDSSTKTLTEEDVVRLARQTTLDQFNEVGTKSSLLNVVGGRHQELADPRSPLSRAVFERYEDYEQDPANKLLYPKDPRAEVPMTGPNGEQMMVNARLVDRLCAELKLSGAVEEGRRQESRAAQVGTVQGGNPSSSRTPTKRFVEAVDLLTPGERDMIGDTRILKGWPQLKEAYDKGGLKGAAKYLYSTFDESDKAKRLAAYRNKGAA